MGVVREELRTKISLDTKEVEEGAKRTEGRISRMLKWIAGVGAVVGLGVAAWKLWNMYVERGNQKLLNAGRAFALTRTEIDLMNSLAKASGQQFNNLAGTFDVFSDTLGAGIEKNRGFQRALKQIGIEAFHGTSAGSKFIQILEALANVGDRFERKQLARQIFGAGAGGIRGIAALGSREFKAMVENAKELYGKFAPAEITARPPRAPGMPAGIGAGLRGGMLGGWAMGGRQEILGPPSFRGVTAQEYEIRSLALEEVLKQIAYNTEGLKQALKETGIYQFGVGLKTTMIGA